MKPLHPVHFGLLLSLLLSCAPSEDDGLTLLDPRGQLLRLSMDLRGTHPSLEELAAMEADPSLYGAFVEGYLGDPRFLERVRELFNLRYLTRTGDTYFDLAEAGIDEALEGEVAEAIGDEMLRLVSHTVEEDLPFSEVVLAEYTLANPALAQMWDMDYPEGGSGWEVTHYRDQRPEAGILSMTGSWQRYPSMGGNANRHRANAVSRLLLCDDYLARPIVLNRAAVDQLTEDPENAIANNSTCQSCHSTLDPLAAHFYGFFHYDGTETLREATLYLPENEEGWKDYSGKAPGYFGVPTSGLRELAENIAQDPRFTDCAVRTVFEGLTQRDLENADWGEFQQHRDAFLAGEGRLVPLFRSIVTSRAYLARATTDATLSGRLATVKTASPAQLAQVMEDLTGYRWTFDGKDGMTTHDLGLPVLSGGVDGTSVTLPSYAPSLGTALVQERLAEAAAWHVVQHDLDPEREGEARLLKYVNTSHTPENAPDRFTAQIRDLYLNITGLPLAIDAEEPAQLIALWKQLYSVDASPAGAWAGVVSAVLRDPSVLFY